MNISVRWLNEYLQPGNLTAAAVEEVLTGAGFPIESVTELPDGDARLDVEVTSNRGDCLSHLGVAREIAAATGRKFVPPEVTDRTKEESGDEIGGAFGLENRVSSVPSPATGARNETGAPCPMFTARLIRGVRIGPSPEWMVRALNAVGQRSINNVVDVTNYVLFEYGQPSHVFDLGTIAPGARGGAALVVRWSVKGEKLALLDGRTIVLTGDELVVADAGTDGRGRAVSLAGIMGGSLTQVTDKTTDVLLEAATWAPLAVRRAARRFNMRTDASYRFERTVDARTIDAAARRAVDLIVKLGGPGARVASGVARAGEAFGPMTRVSLRPARCGAVLGCEVPVGEMVRILEAHEVGVKKDGSAGGVLECTVPAHRPDLTREIDLIEEVARSRGLEAIPVHGTLPVRISAPQVSERAARELSGVLTALGYFEAITFTFVSPADSAPFVPAGMATLRICDERRKADPVLRPSVLPSLLACRRANANAFVTHPGGVRLYETASVFAQEGGGGSGRGGGDESAIENVNLALLADAPETPGNKAIDRVQAGVRLLRATIEAAARALGGGAVKVAFEPGPLPVAAFDPAASGAVLINDRRIGIAGALSVAVRSRYDLEHPVVAAEVNLGSLLSLFPARPLVRALPAFPHIERDLSLIVEEQVLWSRIDAVIGGARIDLLEGHDFVGTFRGPQIGQGRKSVTVRLRFRDPARTLRHEEVDPQVSQLMTALTGQVGATLRA